MKLTDETYNAIRGLSRITAGPPIARLRLAGLALTAVLGSLLVIWVSRTTWDRVDRLQNEFAGLKADSFNLGTRIRGEVQWLNDTLLRYRLRGDTNDYDAFRSGAVQLGQWLAVSRTNTATSVESGFLTEIGSAYTEYAAECMKVLEANRARWLSSQAKDFQDSYEKVQNLSLRLLDSCNNFIDNQRAAFAGFLNESKETLTTFKQLLRLALALLLVLAAALVVLVYRGMISPLRQQLTETHAVIERQEKLASLGVLGAGVAHEIRNPLTAIKFRLFSLKKTMPAGADNEDAAVIGSEIARLERIVEDFLQFARPSEPELVKIPARRILQDVRDLLKPQLDKVAIELKVEESDEVWVRVDTQQIKQVLINLIRNSAESIGHDGRITLRVRREEGSSRKGPAWLVILDVADNGKGIPADVQKRLFDPFFTTKEGGTGLGLPIAARIVEKHNGELRYETELRHGTTFSVVLPGVTDHET